MQIQIESLSDAPQWHTERQYGFLCYFLRIEMILETLITVPCTQLTSGEPPSDFDRRQSKCCKSGQTGKGSLCKRESKNKKTSSRSVYVVSKLNKKQKKKLQQKEKIATQKVQNSKPVSLHRTSFFLPFFYLEVFPHLTLGHLLGDDCKPTLGITSHSIGFNLPSYEPTPHSTDKIYWPRKHKKTQKLFQFLFLFLSSSKRRLFSPLSPISSHPLCFNSAESSYMNTYYFTFQLLVLTTTTSINSTLYTHFFFLLRNWMHWKKRKNTIKSSLLLSSCNDIIKYLAKKKKLKKQAIEFWTHLPKKLL